MRLPLLALLAKEPAYGYELKGQLERILGDAYPSPNIGQIYLTLQRLTDRLELINRQRRYYFAHMRELARLGSVGDDNRIASLLVEGAMLHVQADLDWLERCQAELM